MGDYSKETSDIVNASDDLKVGDKVKMSPFYLTNYCGVAHLEGVEGEIVKLTKRLISAEFMVKEDKAMYAAKYGTLPVYNITGVFVRYSGSSDVFMGSPFGFIK